VVIDIKSRKTPEEEELDEKLAELGELESELTQRELDLATLHAELRAFEGRYLRIIGMRYVELDEIEAKIAELQARIAPKDKSSQERAEQARVQAQESAQAVDLEQKPLRDEKFSPSGSLKKLYREVAKTVHPDLANDDKERLRRQRFMVEANKAYEEDDEARLESILREWQISPDSVKGEGVGAELIRVIRKIAQIKQRLDVIESELEELKSSALYKLKVKIEQAEEGGWDLLKEMAWQLDEQIVLATKELKKLNVEMGRRI
jgi:hypothetical protein